MLMHPTISAVVPVYNRFELLKASVESVLAQTVPVSEVILVDDGSFDGTSERLPRFIAGNPAWRDRVRYFHQENQGPGAARNLGIAQATGEWLAFNDNDDMWLPQKLEWQFRALDRFKGRCGACFTDAWFMNNPHMKMTLFQLAGRSGDEAVGMVPDAVKYLLEKGTLTGIHPVWVQTLLARADLVHRVGGFDPSLHCGEDDDFLFRLACETSFCFVGMPMVLIERTPPDARHVGATKKWDKDDFRLQMAQSRFEKRLQMKGSLTGDARRIIRQDLAAVHSGWANWFIQKGEPEKAREAVAKAVRLHPSFGLRAKRALIRFAPSLAKKAVAMRAERRGRRSFGID
jgi:glycosyltransferase involved in cell wall biosynthesis